VLFQTASISKGAYKICDRQTDR